MAIIQKEAYAIFETLKKQLDHLLRDRKFKLFTDHKKSSLYYWKVLIL
jgi:hypothetical protein